MPGRHVAVRLDDFVEERLAAMDSYGEVVDAGVKKFKCSDRTVMTAIARVRQKWRTAEQSTVEERRAKFRAELEYAWKRALVEGDYRAIAVMAKVRADVEGIKAPKKVEHGGTVNLRPVAAMSPEERRREIEILLAKRAGAVPPANPAPALPPGSPDAIDISDIELPPDIRPARGRSDPQRNNACTSPRSLTSC
jgi:hypothetical protein